MTTLLQKAAKGRRSALTALYEENKQTIYVLCYSLLKKQGEAADAAAWVFKNTWGTVLDGKIETEKAFTEFVVKKAVAYCKKQILKKAPKAFNIPMKKNYGIPPVEVGRVNKKADKLSNVLNLMPDLQRFVMVLRVLVDYDTEEIAHAIGIDKNSVQLAQEVEMYNLSRIYDAVQRAGGQGIPATKELLKIAFEDALKNSMMPQATDERIVQYIEGISQPYEQKAKKKNAVIAVCGGLCVVVLVAALVFAGSHGTDADEGAVSGTESSDVASEDASSETEDASADTDTTNGEEDEEEILPTESEIEDEVVAASIENAAYYADITIEDYGLITVALDANVAPETVANFVELAQSGFYDGLTFHRIMDDFMMQGGDPNGDGTGGSEEKVIGEFRDNGYDNDLPHIRGAVSMARSTDYDSGSSQFFIVHADSDFLDGQYACFGYVTEGMDVVDAICEAAEPTDDNGTIPAENQPVIASIVIRDAEGSDSE